MCTCIRLAALRLTHVPESILAAEPALAQHKVC